MSDELIDRLCTDLRPARPVVAGRLTAGIGLGALVSALLMLLVLGPRPDLAAAIITPMFWVKAGYAFALAGIGCWAAGRAARPASAAGPRLLWLIAPLAAVAAFAATQVAAAPAPMRGALVLGGSARICPWLIVLLSIAPFGGIVWAMRGLAPTRLPLAGAVAGLAAGGAGAFVYAVHCTESGAPFLALWYTLGVVIAGLAGAALGSRLLRWR
ncbi:MAG: DUF1109 domain-containing protein [Alphaproteobacteria bacterium]|nr:DUF1109 domain-containing protein [Alphaproteobacteria bacterium]